MRKPVARRRSRVNGGKSQMGNVGYVPARLVRCERTSPELDMTHSLNRAPEGTTMPDKPLIVISHIHEEEALAFALQNALTELFLGGVTFFVSPDRASVDGGDLWLHRIKEAILKSEIVIPLISPRSINRNWINFEAGAGWLSKRVVPLCHSGMSKTDIPEPLHSLRLFDIESDEDIRDLCELIGRCADLAARKSEISNVAMQLRQAAHGMKTHRLAPAGTDPCWVFASSEDPHALDAMEESLNRCASASMCSIALNFFWGARRLENFKRRVLERRMSARVLMANFDSENIRRRLEEEQGETVGASGGKHLVDKLVELERQVDDKEWFTIRTFDHVPTYAMLLFDDEAFIYPYGFATVGNLSPTFYFNTSQAASAFFEQEFEAINNRCVDAAGSG